MIERVAAPGRGAITAYEPDCVPEGAQPGDLAVGIDGSPAGTPVGGDSAPPLRRTGPREQDFYAPLAELLARVEKLDWCAAMGGKVLLDGWGTPDVAGFGHGRRLVGGGKAPRRTVKLVAAEVKTRGALINGFGQACAYKSFAHKVWLAVPRGARLTQLARLEMLCQREGIGLITFNARHPEAPQWEVHLPARNHVPDPRCHGEKLGMIKAIAAEEEQMEAE